MHFPMNFTKFLRTTFFTEQLWATASILIILNWRKTKLNLLFQKTLSKTQLNNKIDSKIEQQIVTFSFEVYFEAGFP